jgi:hypothetical protein
MHFRFIVFLTCAFLHFGTEPSRKNIEARWKLGKKERETINEREKYEERRNV